MNNYNPGDGWREITAADRPPYGDLIVHHADDPHGRGIVRRWVRKDSVPPLPTALWTMIEVIFVGGDVDTWFLDKRRNWRSTADGDLAGRSDITSFEVLAVPETAGVIARTVAAESKRVRRETAEAVADAIRLVSRGDGGYYDHQFTARQLRDVIARFTGVSE